MGDVILGGRSRNSGHFPKLDVKTVEIPDESVNDDLFPLFLSFHGLNLKQHRATESDRDHATHVAELQQSEDDEGGDAAEEDDVAADNEVDHNVFDGLDGTWLHNVHRRPHLGNDR